MKRSNLIQFAVLAAALGGVAWLFFENHRLRAELGTSRDLAPAPGKQVHSKTSPVVSQGTKVPGTESGQPVGAVTKDKSTGKPLLPVAKNAPFDVVDNGDGTFTVSDTLGAWRQVMTPEQWREFKQKMDMAMTAATTKLPGGPSWSPGKASGPPDTANAGDYPTAWASQSPDGGQEWLQLKYPKSVEISEINIHESYNPGALAKVSAIMPDGSEKVIWKGVEDRDDGIIERAVKVPKGIRSDQIRIELDTSRVPGWNEIDAVELVGTDGSRQWAKESTASSYYGQGRENGLTGNTLILSDGLQLESGGLEILVK